MKKTKAIIIIIFFSIMCLNIQMTSAYKEEDLFKDILKKTNGTVVESGITVFFESKNNDEEICIKLLEQLGLYDKDKIKVLKDDKICKIQFDSDYTKGFIQSVNNCNSIILSITNIESADNLTILENKITNVLQKECKNIKHYRYIKAKLPDNSIESIEKDTLAILNSHHASNINTAKINNGYSINAYTQKYEPIKYGNKLIDFHCIICNYSSGNYIILGTPEIRITY